MLFLQINSLSSLAFTLAHGMNLSVHLYPSPYRMSNVPICLTPEWTAAVMPESLWQSLKLDYHSGVHQSQIISVQLIKVRIFSTFYSSGSGSTRINWDLHFHFNFKKPYRGPKPEVSTLQCKWTGRERLNSCWGSSDTKIRDNPGLDGAAQFKTTCQEHAGADGVIIIHYLQINHLTV